MDADAPTDEPSRSSRYLGWETDIFVAWRITSDIALNMRYGVFFPGDGITSTKTPRQFFFTGISYSF